MNYEKLLTADKAIKKLGEAVNIDVKKIISISKLLKAFGPAATEYNTILSKLREKCKNDNNMLAKELNILLKTEITLEYEKIELNHDEIKEIGLNGQDIISLQDFIIIKD